MLYQPAEDSFFFSEFLKKELKKLKNRNLKFLDIGTGSGILAETASSFIKKENIFTVDINLEAVKLLKQKGFKSIKSDLFSNVVGKFDIIVFNAPYLPKDKREPKNSQRETTGGTQGDEISLKFLEQARLHLNKKGKIFLLVSILTPQDKLKKFKPEIVARKKIFFEELIILAVHL